jgi:hypothetical protein
VAAPPPEVAADPARLKVYNDEHNAPPPDPYAGNAGGGRTYFLVGKGCGHADVYACWYVFTSITDAHTALQSFPRDGGGAVD